MTVTYGSRNYTVYPRLVVDQDAFGAELGSCQGSSFFTIRGEGPDSWLAIEPECGNSSFAYKEENVADLTLSAFSPDRAFLVSPNNILLNREVVDAGFIPELLLEIGAGTPIRYASLTDLKDSITIRLRSDDYPSLIFELNCEEYGNGMTIVTDNLRESAYRISDDMRRAVF
jgi:hypothetical protein